MQEYELAQGKRFLQGLTQSGSALSRCTDRIREAVDFLFHVLPSYNLEQISHGWGGDSPVQIC